MNKQNRECDENLIDSVLAAASGHKAFGPGLLESVYEDALIVELDAMGIPAQKEVEIPAQYRGRDLGLGFRADIIANESLLLEIKSGSELSDLHLVWCL